MNQKTKNDDLNIYQIISEINKRRKVFILVFLLLFIPLAIFLFTIPKKYTSTASFFFPLKSGGGLDLLQNIGAGGGEAAGGGAMMSLLGMGGNSLSDYAVAILESREVTDYMIGKYKDRVFDDPAPGVTMVELRKEWAGVAKIDKTEEDIILINVTTETAELSAEIANEYIAAYKAFAEKSTLTFAQQKREYVEEQRDRISRELEEAEKEMLAFQNKKEILDIPEETKVLLSYFSEMQGFMTISEAAHIEARTKLAAIRDSMKKQADAAEQNINIPLMSDDPTVQSIYAEIENATIKLAQMKESMTDEHPDVQAQEDLIANLRGKMQNKISTRLSTINSNLTPELIEAESTTMALKARVSAYRNVMDEIEGRMQDLPELSFEYGRLFRDVSIKSKVLAFAEMELEKARLEEAREASNIQILDVAVPPDYKSWPKYSIGLILIFLVSFIGASAAVFLPAFLEEQKRIYREMQEENK